MPVTSSDSLLLSHIEEATPGVTPATPAFKPWRLTSESITFDPNTVASAELGVTGRSAKPSNVVGTTVTGDISIELSKFPALDEAIAGILANEWGEGPLTPGLPGGGVDGPNRNTVGRKIKTYTIEKRWPNQANVAGAMPMTATPSASSGVSIDITMAGGAAVGSGIIVVKYQTDADTVEQQVLYTISAGDDEAATAIGLEAALDAETNLSASAAGPVVTVTPSGGGTNIDNLEADAGSDEYVYQRYRGCTYSALSLTTSPNAIVTGTVSVVAGEPTLAYLPITGATYDATGTDGAVFTAPEVLELSAGSTLPGVQTSCWSSLTLNLDSQNREIACIGSLGSRESALGTFLATASGDLYFVGDQSLLESLLNNEVIGISTITFTNADDDIYRFDLYDSKVTSGSVVATGQNEDVTIPVTLEPAPVTVQTDAGQVWTSSIMVSLENTAPTLP